MAHICTACVVFVTDVDAVETAALVRTVRQDGVKRRNTRRYDAVFLRRIGADGKGVDDDRRIAGKGDSPAFRPAVASDGKGTTLVAYERHPKSADVPIKIGFRILKTK